MDTRYECKSGLDNKNMFPHWKKSGMCEHKEVKEYVSRTQYSDFCEQ